MNEITIVGCGPGAREYLTSAAVEAVDRADVVLGAPRLLDLFPGSGARKIAIRRLKRNYRRLLSLIGLLSEERRVALLVSGDPGVHSLASAVAMKFGRENCRVIPGVSSIQYAFSKLAMRWDDAVILSIHGKEPKDLAQRIASAKKTAILTDDGDGPARVAGLLEDGFDRHYDIYLCEALSLIEERIRKVGVEELRGCKAASLNLLIMVKKEDA